MSKILYETLLATALRADESTEGGFNTRWEAVARLLEAKLWVHGEWRSEKEFLHDALGVSARRGSRLARIARHVAPWAYREGSRRTLKALAALHEETSRVGGVGGSVPMTVRVCGAILPREASEVSARHIRRKTEELRRMPDGGLRRQDLVVLLHGLARTRFSMRPAEEALQARGFLTANIGYHSRSAPYEELAKTVWSAVAQYAGRFERVHFVTHSMGGIVVRELLARGMVERIGRVVMLAPPNHGSEAADGAGRFWLLRFVMGPALKQLGTGPDGPARLGPARAPTAVIAGCRPGVLFSGRFSGPNDGKVSVASARLEGMEAFRVVNEGHTRIMKSSEVHRAIIRYLETGRLEAAEQRSGLPVAALTAPCEV